MKVPEFGGKFYRAEITEAHDYDLVAKVIGGPL